MVGELSRMRMEVFGAEWEATENSLRNDPCLTYRNKKIGAPNERCGVKARDFGKVVFICGVSLKSPSLNLAWCVRESTRSIYSWKAEYV